MYKKKTEAAKKEYLKALAAYRASLVSKVSSALWTADKNDMRLNGEMLLQKTSAHFENELIPLFRREF